MPSMAQVQWGVGYALAGNPQRWAEKRNGGRSILQQTTLKSLVGRIRGTLTRETEQFYIIGEKPTGGSKGKD